MAAAGVPILVVEDDPRIREIIRWALEDEGYAVTTAADGRQALERAAAAPPALVVLDMMLPILDGPAVAAGLRAAPRPMPPIVLVTADGRAAEKAARVGAFAYLHKPFDLDDLIAVVRRGLARAGG